MPALLLLASGALLVVWPDGRAVRVERDGTTTPRQVRKSASSQVRASSTRRGSVR